MRARATTARLRVATVHFFRTLHDKKLIRVLGGASAKTLRFATTPAPRAAMASRKITFEIQSILNFIDTVQNALLHLRHMKCVRSGVPHAGHGFHLIGVEQDKSMRKDGGATNKTKHVRTSDGHWPRKDTPQKGIKDSTCSTLVLLSMKTQLDEWILALLEHTLSVLPCAAARVRRLLLGHRHQVERLLVGRVHAGCSDFECTWQCGRQTGVRRGERNVQSNESQK